MIDRTDISRKKGHHGFELTNSQSIDYNISNNTLPSQTSIIHRSHKHKKRSNALIHVTVKSSNSNHKTKKKIIHLHRKLPLRKKILAKKNFQHQEHDSNELPAVIQHIIEKPNENNNNIHIYGQHDSLSQKSEQKNQCVRPSSYIDRVTTSKSQTYPSKKSSKKKHTKYIWPYETSTSKDDHRSSKKRKKNMCSRRCVITSVLITLIITVMLVVILPITLTQIRTMTTTRPTPVLRWNTTGITVAGQSGVAGNGSNQLNLPKDAAWVSPNILYISDTGNNRIQKYIIGDSNGMTVSVQTSGTGNSSANQLNAPSCVRVDSNSGLYVADTNNNRIQFWSNGALSGLTIAGNGTSGPVNASNQLSSPYGIDRDINSGTLYIADYGNQRIMSYASGASSGTVVAGGNGAGKNSTQLYNPIRVYFDSLSNSLVITNHGTHNIVRWILGASHSTLIAGDPDGNIGNTSTQLRFPTDVVFDPMGNMYIADKDNYRIQLFMVGQSEAITIAGVTRVYGNTSTLLYQPWSLKLDNQLNLYVADSRNHRIQKFVRY